MNTIYKVHVPITSQEQANRMKQLCIDYGLPIWKDSIAFLFNLNKSTFEYGKGANEFWITSWRENKTEISEQQFIELLKNHK